MRSTTVEKRQELSPMYGRLDLYAGRIAIRIDATWHWAELPPGVLAVGPSVWPNTFDAIGPADCILDRELRAVFRCQLQPDVENPWLTMGDPIAADDLKPLRKVRFGRVAVVLHEGILTDGGDMDFGDDDDLTLGLET